MSLKSACILAVTLLRKIRLVKPGVKALLITLLALSLSACSAVSFYTQAATGQLSLLMNRQSIAELIASADTPPELLEKLQLVSDARQFAINELGLPDNGSYTSYVDVERSYLVWNVFAAPAFAMQPLQWCFPIAGCVSYRGYFTESAARDFASDLEKRGFDVYIGGVDAYSTLGWFADPIPSTVMRRPDHRLAGLIFHEMAHQQIYVPGDTQFNESFASFVEQLGVERWLARNDDENHFQTYLAEQEEQRRFTEFVQDWRQRFEQLYQAPDADQESKQTLQQQMRESWRAQSRSGRYDGWFAGPLNNAQLLTVSTYFDWVPAFAALYQQSGEDLMNFYQAVESLAELPPEERTQRLMVLGSRAAGR